jgi:hypothetical protein
MAYQQQSQHSQQSSPTSQNHRSTPQQRTASREQFLWRRKLDLEEQTLDTTARIKALQDKLTLIEDQKKKLRHELLGLQDKLRPGFLAALLTHKPQPDLRLLESQVRHLVEEERATKSDLSFAQHLLDSLHAKIAYLEHELSRL